jgi:hydroxypyruvate isomerase
LNAVICIEMLFPELSAYEKIAAIANEGFQNVEFWDWRDKDQAAVAETCAAHGVRVANFSGHRQGSLVAAGTHDLFLSELQESIRAAGRLDCPYLMLVSNALKEGGIVADSFDEIPEERKYADVPGRHEPGSGRIDWDSLVCLLAACGYSGFVGFEYSPQSDSKESLHRIRDFWQRVNS